MEKKLIEIGEQYNAWLVSQIEKLSKTCQIGKALIFLLVLTNSLCVALLLVNQKPPAYVTKTSCSLSIPEEQSMEEKKEITFEEVVLVTDRKADIGIRIPETMKGKYKVSLYVEDKLLFSDVLYPGSTLSTVELKEELEAGNYHGRIKVENMEGDGSDDLQRNISVRYDGKKEPCIIEGGLG